MNYFVQQGRKIEVYGSSIEINKTLKPVPYELSTDTRLGTCSLVECSEFQVPEKLYDVEKDFRAMVLNSFNKTHKNVGVLLHGEKGQGKSVCAKLLATESNLPIIIINKSIDRNVNFTSFIDDLETDLVVFIDEFEKIIPKTEDKGDNDPIHTQDSFLTFMDGSSTSKYKRLFIFTTNDRVSDKFINRPTRIRYYKKYEYLEQEIYDMIIKDKLLNKEYEKDLRDNLSIFDCNIDLLTTVIEEINIQDKPYGSFKNIFNHKPKTHRYSRYKLVADDRWEYYDFIEVKNKIDKETTYIGELSESIQVVNINEKELVYKTKQYMDKVPAGFKVQKKRLAVSNRTEDNDGFIDVYYKLKEEPNTYMVL